jgi:hypothetical protein
MKEDNKSDGAVKAAIIIVLGPAIIALIGIGWDKLFPPQSLSHLAGNWKVIEKLKSKEDNSEIDWQYSADIVNKDTLRLSGKKIKENLVSKRKQLDRSTTVNSKVVSLTVNLTS